MSMLPKLVEIGSFKDGDKSDWAQRQALVNEYIAPALEIYFSRHGMNPFGGDEK